MKETSRLKALEKVESDLTPKNPGLTPNKNRKLRRLDLARSMLQAEKSWSDLKHGLGLNEEEMKEWGKPSDSTLSRIIKDLNGEISPIHCDPETHKNHENETGASCRKCYILSGGGAIIFNYIMEKIRGDRIDGKQKARYVELASGIYGPYNFAKFYSAEDAKLVIKEISKLEFPNLIEKGIGYRLFIEVLQLNRFSKEEKESIYNEVSTILEELLKTVKIDAFDIPFIEQLSALLALKFILHPEKFFVELKDLMKHPIMKQKSAFQFEYGLLLSLLYKTDEKLRNSKEDQKMHASPDLRKELAKHQKNIVDLYSSCSENDVDFYRQLLEFVGSKEI
ncbi:MAG: hypothetical protein ACP5UZ_08065 [Thermoplasmata archaeon]